MTLLPPTMPDGVGSLLEADATADYEHHAGAGVVAGVGAGAGAGVGRAWVRGRWGRLRVDQCRGGGSHRHRHRRGSRRRRGSRSRCGVFGRRYCRCSGGNRRHGAGYGGAGDAPGSSAALSVTASWRATPPPSDAATGRQLGLLKSCNAHVDVCFYIACSQK